MGSYMPKIQWQGMRAGRVEENGEVDKWIRRDKRKRGSRFGSGIQLPSAWAFTNSGLC